MCMSLVQDQALMLWVWIQTICQPAGLQSLTYSKAVRLGKPPAEAKAGQQVRPRPMLVKFGAVQQKHELLQQSKALCGQKVYLDDDLTPYQRSMPAKLSTVFSLLSFYKRPRFWRQEAFSPCMRGSWCHVICALCLQAVAVLQQRHEYSTQHLQGVKTAAGQHMPAPDVAVAPGAWLIVVRMMRVIYEDEHGTHGQRGRSGR